MGLIKIVINFADGSRAWDRIGTKSPSKYVALFSNKYLSVEFFGTGKKFIYLERKKKRKKQLLSVIKLKDQFYEFSLKYFVTVYFIICFVCLLLLLFIYSFIYLFFYFYLDASINIYSTSNPLEIAVCE